MSANILLVDDDIAIRTPIASALSQAGYSVTETDNGVDAYQLILSTKPQVIIADLNMPRMSGIELVAKLREDKDQTPVIILTSDQSIDTLNDALSLNVHDYFNKDESDLKLLVETVRKYA